MTLNLSGAATDNLSPLINLSPSTSPKTPTTPSGVLNGGPSNVAALITFNTPPASPVFGVSSSSSLSPDTDADSAAAPLNNSNVTITHFSEQRGGVVEKISVMSSPKVDNKTRATAINSKNPFINNTNSSDQNHSSPIGKTASTNPFLRAPSVDLEMENNNNINNSNLSHVGEGRTTTEETVKTNNSQEKRKVDKNPFREGDQLRRAIDELMIEGKRNGNGKAAAEEIVTVSEIDGGRAAEIIRVSVAFVVFIHHIFNLIVATYC